MSMSCKQSSLCPFQLILLLLLLIHLPLFTFSYSHVSQQFETWCKEYGKTYPTEEEKLHRLKVFEENYAFITQHNMGNHSYTLSLNVFADLSHQEFKASRLGLSPGVLKARHTHPVEELQLVREIPSSVDWRMEGAVTPVKDQGYCGACWAFSATGAIEGINKFFTGSLVSLSEQELIDCDTSYNSGCEGGLMDYAFEFVIKNHGIDTEEDYPYQGLDRSCNKDKLERHVATIDGYVELIPNNEKRLLLAVAAQPVSVGLCGSERAFQFYSAGIFSGPCSTSLDHAALIVGYDSENGVDYWIVKNSWGTHWGMDGYIYMLRNTGEPEGLCGINMLASYPIKSSTIPPPPPPPHGKWCSPFTYCSAGKTCCCKMELLGICFNWECCELDSAVFARNKNFAGHKSREYPIRDTSDDECLKRIGK